MSVTGNITRNADQSKNHFIGFTRQEDSYEVSGSLFLNGARDKDRLGRPAETFDVAGASLGVQNSASAASITAQHIPSFGNQLTGAASLSVLQGRDHSVSVNAFSTANLPKASPNFLTHGAGIDAQVGRVGANAAVAHTPVFKSTDYSVGGRVNLHQSPTSSTNFNIGATKSVTPFSNGSWHPGAAFSFVKKF